MESGSDIFFKDTATTEIYTLSLHDALPISSAGGRRSMRHFLSINDLSREDAQFLLVEAERLKHELRELPVRQRGSDRKSTRLNSSHANISYAVFCLKTTSSTRRSARPASLA